MNTTGPNKNQSAKKSFWLRCPFCRSAFVAHLISHKFRGKRRNGEKENPPSPLDLDPDELSSLVKELPLAQIAAIYGVTPKQIENTCRSFGIETKSKGKQP